MAELAILEQRLSSLAQQWKQETRWLSSLGEMARHPAYREIISQGPEAVPFLLRELEREPDQWFMALQAITGADPVPREERGDLRKMTRRWLDWGRERHVI